MNVVFALTTKGLAAALAHRSDAKKHVIVTNVNTTLLDEHDRSLLAELPQGDEGAEFRLTGFDTASRQIIPPKRWSSSSRLWESDIFPTTETGWRELISAYRSAEEAARRDAEETYETQWREKWVEMKKRIDAASQTLRSEQTGANRSNIMADPKGVSVYLSTTWYPAYHNPPAALLPAGVSLTQPNGHTYARFSSETEEFRIYHEMLRLAQERKAKEDREKQQREEEEYQANRIASEAAERDMQEWTQVHGSEHLKLCAQEGYNCQRLYVTERSALEFPDFELDYDNRARWQRRSGPSVTALKRLVELKQQHPGAKLEIVWMTKGVRKEDAQIGSEAIVLSDYLGEYRLIEFMGDPMDNNEDDE